MTITQLKAWLLIASTLLSSCHAQTVPITSGSAGSPFATNEATGPFTFDGFEFGFGGLDVNDPNLLTRAFVQTIFNRIVNNPALAFLTLGIPNQLRRPSDFLPQSLRQRVQLPVTQLYGYDLLDRYLALLYAVPTSSPGAIRPAGCIGPIYALNVNGGNCTVSSTTGEVACSTPVLTLSISALTCTGFWRQGCAFAGPLVRANVPLSPLRGGYLGNRPSVRDFGTALNLTRVQLGFNINSRRVLNDFGVTRWYFYLVAFLGFLLLRAARALIATPIPTLLTQASVAVTGSRPVPGTLNTSGGGTRFKSSSGNESSTNSMQARLEAMMERLLQSATSKLHVERKAMPSADAFYQNPEELATKVATDLKSAGLQQFSQLLQEILGTKRASNSGRANASSASSSSDFRSASDSGNRNSQNAGTKTPSNRITNQQLGTPKFGTFDVQGAYNPSQPASEGQQADTLGTLLWRRSPSSNKNGTAQDILYEQLGAQMKRLLPSQGEVLDDLAHAADQADRATSLWADMLGNSNSLLDTVFGDHTVEGAGSGVSTKAAGTGSPAAAPAA